MNRIASPLIDIYDGNARAFRALVDMIKAEPWITAGIVTSAILVVDWIR